MKIYDNKKRQQVPTTFKVGQVVRKNGKEYQIGVVDAWAADEVYLCLETIPKSGSFLIVDSKEVR